MPGRFIACWVVHRVDPNRPPANLRGKRVDERLTDVAKTRSLMRAASENDRDVRTRIRMRGTTAGGCAHQRQGRRNHDTNDANKAAWSHLHMLTYCRRPRWRWAAET